jgi:predicted O-methyltransferase YrrM
MGTDMVFNEDWMSEEQVEVLRRLIEMVAPKPGRCVEIGCWEGKSTVGLANACYPERLLAIDSWQGNLTEGDNHETVQILKHRDVFETFRSNIDTLTKGNVEIVRSDCFDFLESFGESVKFCHIDAAHDYASVRRTIELLLPRLVAGAILCGDDYLSAHAGRDDLQGGVQRAVQELLPGHANHGNMWIWVKEGES